MGKRRSSTNRHRRHRSEKTHIERRFIRLLDGEGIPYQLGDRLPDDRIRPTCFVFSEKRQGWVAILIVDYKETSTPGEHAQSCREQSIIRVEMSTDAVARADKYPDKTGASLRKELCGVALDTIEEEVRENPNLVQHPVF